jgi:branched-chain amino acid transport system ATP-binding protein
MLLSVRDVTLRFGGIVALDGVSFDVDRGVVSGLIGPNGAGKTTVFNVITRLYTPDSGEVELDGHDAAADPAASGSCGVASPGRSRTSTCSAR